METQSSNFSWLRLNTITENHKLFRVFKVPTEREQYSFVLKDLLRLLEKNVIYITQKFQLVLLNYALL